jgi:iron complex outermembrane receptor protein
VVTREPNDSEHYEFFGSLGTRLRAAGFYGNVPITDTLSMSLTGSFDHRNGIGKFVNLPGKAPVSGRSTSSAGVLH